MPCLNNETKQGVRQIIISGKALCDFFEGFYINPASFPAVREESPLSGTKRPTMETRYHSQSGEKNGKEEGGNIWLAAFPQ